MNAGNYPVNNIRGDEARNLVDKPCALRHGVI